ncbi:hypothetical protein INT43_000090 [Umbelopsis isabellina]|uniref:Uncharacterized protein n=1 Tax=Mortierella isabellina TaxID=91625 RepID=A0A8H7PF29_MORIS|nr:hypothetical protein INT43_000090 [Umbelopsis isabellina]
MLKAFSLDRNKADPEDTISSPVSAPPYQRSQSSGILDHHSRNQKILATDTNEPRPAPQPSAATILGKKLSRAKTIGGLRSTRPQHTMDEHYTHSPIEQDISPEDDQLRYPVTQKNTSMDSSHRLERTSSLVAGKDRQYSNESASPRNQHPVEEECNSDDRQNERDSSENGQDQARPMDAEESGPLEPPHEELLQQLEGYEAMLNRLQTDLELATIRNKDLNNELGQTRKLLQRREQEYARIEHNFFEHTKLIRATDDDLSTIRDTFKLLKYGITRFVMSLNKKADREKATEKFLTMWPNLPLSELGTPLEHGHINMLTEKLIHQHLVNLIFESPLYPGLHINGAYSEMNRWLQVHGSDFSTRLRQQLSAIIAKSKPDSETQQEAQAARAEIIDRVYNDLAEIYDPFLRESDGSQEGNAGYIGKVREIIDKSLRLSIAIRGQDVDIHILPVKEGEQSFDEETMVELKGKNEGKIKFCICPPFVGGDGEHGFVEKGKVVC